MIKKIISLVNSDSIIWRHHCLKRMLERNISRQDVKDIIFGGEVIKEYIDDKPFQSYLFFRIINNRPLHALVSVDIDGNMVYIITVYEPSKEVFESDFRTRRKI